MRPWRWYQRDIAGPVCGGGLVRDQDDRRSFARCELATSTPERAEQHSEGDHERERRRAPRRLATTAAVVARVAGRSSRVGVATARAAAARRAREPVGGHDLREPIRAAV